MIYDSKMHIFMRVSSRMIIPYSKCNFEPGHALHVHGGGQWNDLLYPTISSYSMRASHIASLKIISFGTGTSSSASWLPRAAGRFLEIVKHFMAFITFITDLVGVGVDDFSWSTSWPSCRWGFWETSVTSGMYTGRKTSKKNCHCHACHPSQLCPWHPTLWLPSSSLPWLPLGFLDCSQSHPCQWHSYGANAVVVSPQPHSSCLWWSGGCRHGRMHRHD